MGYKICFKYLKDRSFVKIKGKNKISCSGRVRLSTIKISGENNSLIVKNGARINKSNIWINGKNNQVTIGEDCDLNNLTIIMDNSNGIIEIGKKTTCGKTQIVSLEPYDIKIGEDCMISYDVEIRNTDSHRMIDNETGEWINKGRSVIIGDRVWIASRAMILKGTEIGNNSIIGTGTIVNKKINRNVVAVGNPAKEVKTGISWTRESVISK